MNKQELEKIKEKALEEHIPIIMDDTLEVIEKELKAKPPKKILEIGAAVGYSAINFVNELEEDVYVKTIERNDKRYEEAIKNINSIGYSKFIDVVHADATEYLPNLNEDNSYDVVFIDAAKGQYLKFLENGIRLAKDGAIIIADNVLFKGRVLSDYNEHKHRTAVNRLRSYLEIINSDKRLKSTVMNIGDGIAVSVIKK